MHKMPLLEELNPECLKKLAKNIGGTKTIYEHTKDVLDTYDNFFKSYPTSFNEQEKELIYLACLYHDLGKSNVLFQNKLISNIKQTDEIPHGFLSPLFLPIKEIKERYGQESYEVLATAIFYHHTKKYEMKDKDYDDFAEKYILKPFHMQSRFSPKSLNYGLLFQYPSEGIEMNKETWQQFTKVKGMLNRFDYTASSGNLYPEAENKNLEITKKIKKNFPNLTDMQKYASKNIDKNLILIGSTGSGKTESALLWLNNSKGFYTLPLKVASNSIYQRIKNNYADESKDSVALLHSDSFEILKEENIDYNEYKQMKLLSSPLTVCTVDQIFKFPFKALGQEQYIATLSYSKVIIDEIQMYSPLITACLLVGLKEIVESGGKFMITTATFPNFLRKKLNQIIGEENYEIKTFIQEKEKNRHYISIIENDFNYDHILKSSKDKKVLIICNTVKKSIEVYHNLKRKKAQELHLLHARFIKNDRDRLEKEIKTFESSDLSGIWVTTQLVEASLDIDFDELHTEIAPADSLIQRFGRCYRKREYTKDEPNIYIYNNKIVNKIYEEKLVDLSKKKLEKYNLKLMTEKDKIEYLDSVYDENILKEEKIDYIKELNEKINKFKNLLPLKYDNNEIQKEFRDINTINVIPDRIYEENIMKITNLIEIIENKSSLAKEKYEAKRELLGYTVPIYKIKKDEVEIKDLDIYRVPGKYSSETGFERQKNDEDRFI